MRPRERGAAGRRTPDQTAEDGNNDTAIIAPKVDFSNQMVADACIGDVAVHPLAGLFPMMTDAEIDRLAADIRAVGQREPIVMYKGSVLDGRNRLEACRRLGHSPLRTEYEGVESDIASFVVSLNLHRRHLDESQRAMVAARLANLPHGVRADASIDASAVTQQHAPIGASVTQDAAADMLSVGRRSVQRAREVIATGKPELVAAVERGDVAVSRAASLGKIKTVSQLPDRSEKPPANQIRRWRNDAAIGWHMAKKFTPQQRAHVFERLASNPKLRAELVAFVARLVEPLVAEVAQ